MDPTGCRKRGSLFQPVKEPFCGIDGVKPGKPQCAAKPADSFHRKPRVSEAGKRGR